MKKFKGFAEMDKKLCVFSSSNGNYCRKPVVEGSNFCGEHHGLKCVSCGKQAERRCSEEVYAKCGLCAVVRISRLCDELLCWKKSCESKHNLCVHSKEQKKLRKEFWEDETRSDDYADC